MSHVIVQNAGELPIWGMRLLGLSNKAEDQIGRFGTGLKESIALLARMDNLPIIFSGSCKIEFAVRCVDGQKEICFKLSEKRASFPAKRWHGLGIHPNFGQADWNDPWMVFREVICNALDESGTDNLYHDIVSTDPIGIGGSTRVYIPVNSDILTAYSTIHDKLLPIGAYEVELEIEGRGQVFAKKTKKDLQIFHRGVWVQEYPERPSLYDYELTDLPLNESRFADWYYVNERLAKMIVGFSIPQAKKLLITCIKDREIPYECDVLSGCSCYMRSDVDSARNWFEAFQEIWGENAVITDNDKFFYDRLNAAGKQPVVVTNSGVMDLLKSAGVPHAASILSRAQREYEVLENPNERQQEVFDEVWDKLESLNLTGGKSKPGLMVFRQRPGVSTIVFGEYRGGICHINMDYGGTKQERLACLEEIAHHITEQPDQSREFQNWLVEALDTALS